MLPGGLRGSRTTQPPRMKTPGYSLPTTYTETQAGHTC